MCVGGFGRNSSMNAEQLANRSPGLATMRNRLQGNSAEVLSGQSYAEYAASGGSRKKKDFDQAQKKLAEANKGQAVSVTESNTPEADATAASAQTNTVRRRRTGANAFGTAQDATILNASNTTAAPSGMLLGG